MQQTTEMLDYLIAENQHEVLGVCPPALQEIFDLLRTKLTKAKSDFEDLEAQKQEFGELHILREHLKDVENEKERLQTFEQSYLEA